MKRSLSLVFLLMLLCACYTALAAERGEEVTITFEIVDNEFEAISARVGVEFDPKVFEFVSAEKISTDVLTNAPVTSDASFGLVNLNGIQPGPLGTITLRIKKDAPSGAHAVTPKVDAVYNSKREEVHLNVKGETISLDHVWDDGRVTVVATCYSEGVMRYRCYFCDAAREEVIPMTEHKEGEPIATTVATCTRDGWQIYPCAICGDVLREEAIPAIGHTEGETVVTQEPTATVPGIRVTQCANCGKTIRTEEIPATGPVRLPGDADGSGKVDIMDALAVLQAAVGWSTPIDRDASDVDGSGAVDIMDALLILQYSVGWDVELK